MMISVSDRVVFAAMEFVEVVEAAEIMSTLVTAIELLGVAKTTIGNFIKLYMENYNQAL